MKKIEIVNTLEMDEFLSGTETGRVTVPFNTNFLLLNEEEPSEFIEEIENVAVSSGRSLHLH